jgi:hypothetical protein
MLDDDELSPQEKFYAESPEATVPRDLARGRSRREIIADLVRLGQAPADAAAFVDQVAAELERFRTSPEGRRELLNEAKRQIIGGLVMAALGLAGVAFAVVTLLLGFPVGWLILVSAGLLILGLGAAGRGYHRWCTYRSDAVLTREDDDRDQPGSLDEQ